MFMMPMVLPESIQSPSQPKLNGEFIRWTVMHDCPSDQSSFAATETDGSLNDFIKLSSASDEEVLAFVRRRGVLGIFPRVEIVQRRTEGVQEDGMGFSCSTGIYNEPIYLYNQLARQAQNILRVMHSLKSGKAISEGFISGMFPSALIYDQAQKVYDVASSGHSGKPRETKRIFGMGRTAFAMWQQEASIHVYASSQDVNKGGRNDFAISRPSFTVDFGNEYTDQKIAWDRQHNVSLRPPVSAQEYLDHSKHVSQYLPCSAQRSSPLFSVLTFQLMQEIVVEEGTFFCAGCGEMRTRDLNKQDKPRTDRAEYCSNECKAEGRRKYEREYKARTNTRKRSSGQAQIDQLIVDLQNNNAKLRTIGVLPTKE